MNTNGHGCRREIQKPPEKIRITELFAPSFREEETGSLWKSVFLSVHPWFSCIVPAKVRSCLLRFAPNERRAGVRVCESNTVPPHFENRRGLFDHRKKQSPTLFSAFNDRSGAVRVSKAVAIFTSLCCAAVQWRGEQERLRTLKARLESKGWSEADGRTRRARRSRRYLSGQVSSRAASWRRGRSCSRARNFCRRRASSRSLGS